MNKKKFTKLPALYLPYLVIGLAATNLGEAWRLAEGKELGDKIVSLMGTLPAASRKSRSLQNATKKKLRSAKTICKTCKRNETRQRKTCFL